MNRFGTGIKELTGTAFKTALEIYVPSGTRPCIMCGGTGVMTIPVFDFTTEVATAVPFKSILAGTINEYRK